MRRGRSRRAYLVDEVWSVFAAGGGEVHGEEGVGVREWKGVLNG